MGFDVVRAKGSGSRLAGMLVLLAGFVCTSYRGLSAAQQSGQPSAEQGLSPAALDELLARLPDPLLIQVLMCSTSCQGTEATNRSKGSSETRKGANRAA